MAQNSSKIYQNFWIALLRNSEILMYLVLAVLSSFYEETFLEMSHQVPSCFGTLPKDSLKSSFLTPQEGFLRAFFLFSRLCEEIIDFRVIPQINIFR